MTSSRVRPSTEILEIMEEYADELMEVAANAAAELLDYKMGYSSQKRTGQHWPGNPRRSSRFGEYPQEQTGDTQRSIGVVREGHADYAVGFFGEDPPGKAEYLEEVRGPLYMLFEGQDADESQRVMNKAIEDAVGGGSR